MCYTFQGIVYINYGFGKIIESEEVKRACGYYFHQKNRANTLTKPIKCQGKSI